MEKELSIICNYDGNQTRHFQRLDLDDIGKWIECYRFTHPQVKSISIKVWFNEQDEQN